MPNIDASIASNLRSQGSVLPRSLLEMETVDGTRLYFADGAISLYSSIGAFDIGGPPRVDFIASLIDPPAFQNTGTMLTATATATLQNLSGSTIQRDGTILFSKQQLWGALFIFRLWHPTCEYDLRKYVGNVTDVEVDDDKVELTLQKSSNWSAIPAPDCNVSPNCQLTFGSAACGSTSPTPCQNTYGTCSQINRFKGVVSTFNTGDLSVLNRVGLAQTGPIAQINFRRPS